MLFIFNCLDIFNTGKLDSYIVNMFFKDILRKLKIDDFEAEQKYKIEDIKDEIFDMANVKNKKFLSFYDLLESGQGDIILSLLIDSKIFFDYD